MERLYIQPGDRYGAWEVIREAERGNDGRRFISCRCTCGREKEVQLSDLHDGKSTKCRRCAGKTNFLTHGLSVGKAHKPSEYTIWVDMKKRCNNPRQKNYENYGGRGIKVCDRWINSPENFLADMGERPSSRHSIDRIDVNGDYCPENCRWATRKEQGQNKRTNHQITFEGETLTLTDWAERFQIDRNTLTSRLKVGWSVEKALTTPVKYKFASKNHG